MAAFHVRDIPPELLERLRARAAAEGRSMNAEILTILERELSRRTPEEVMQSIRERRDRIALSPKAPRPEDLIREGRDSRYRRP
jgi:plasmid stability protein